MASPTRRERIAGGLVGLLVGDALGVPYEFHPPQDIPPRDHIEMTPPPGFARAHAGVLPGAWSDDGAQALCLLDSLLACGRFDADDFARRLLRWSDDGYLAVGGDVFDIGGTTSRALAALRRGTPALMAGPSAGSANGNGSLMRVLPLALWHQGDDGELAADAMAQSRVTHGHLRAQVCCALACLWARRILAGMEARDGAWHAAVTAFRNLWSTGSAPREELEHQIHPDDPPSGTGSGYVLDTLRSARLVLGAGDYPTVVRAAIALGYDTDTTACVAGGLAGIRDGVEAIPQTWRGNLREWETLGQPLLDALLRHAGSSAL